MVLHFSYLAKIVDVETAFLYDINVVSNSNSDSRGEGVKNNKDKFFDEDIDDQVKISPQTTVNAKVV